MKTKHLVLLSLISTSLAVYGAPTLTLGTPANAYLSTPTGVAPRLGTLINFDELTPYSALNPSQYVSEGVMSISSPDGLIVAPYSTQSGPNFLFDNSRNGTADISIRMARGIAAIGIGIADADNVSIALEAINASGGYASDSSALGALSDP